MNNVRIHAAHFLGAEITGRRAKTLLIEWANIPDYPPEAKHAKKTTEDVERLVARVDAATERLIKRFPELFPPQAEKPYEHYGTVQWVKGYLLCAWNAPDLRQREWYIFKARDAYHSSTAVHPIMEAAYLRDGTVAHLTPQEELAREQPPDLTPFEQAMYYFHRSADHARRCANPECPAPYFFAAKKGQKYCSSKCSAPAQREQKRMWWQKNRAKA